jgi:hypothetical protein
VLYSRQLWPLLGQLLGEVAAGETALLTQIVTALLEGAGEPSNAQQASLAADEAWPRSILPALEADQARLEAAPRLGAFAPAAIDQAFWPVDDEDAYSGDFVNPDDASPVLVIGTLGNATLLTSDGDGHTAYGRSGPCIDDAVEAYLVDLSLPAEGTVCVQDPTYDPTSAPASTSAASIGDLPMVDERSMFSLDRVVDELVTSG